jgi:hypothetical protein
MKFMWLLAPCRSLVLVYGHSEARRIKPIKIVTAPTGNRNRYFPACGAVCQLSASPPAHDYLQTLCTFDYHVRVRFL